MVLSPVKLGDSSVKVCFHLVFLLSSSCNVLSRPFHETQSSREYIPRPVNHPPPPTAQSAHLLAKKQEVIAVPPVMTSILHGPYLPPANANNQIFLPPHYPHGLFHHHRLFGGFHGYRRLNYGFHGYHREPHMPYGHFNPFIESVPSYNIHSRYHRVIPYGISHQYHTHWPHMSVSGGVVVSDPNDGMYQVPGTGALIPRPIMPQQYPVMLDHAMSAAGQDGPGVVFVGGQGKSMIPVDLTNVENQILHNKANLHSNPRLDVQELALEQEAINSQI